MHLLISCCCINITIYYYIVMNFSIPGQKTWPGACVHRESLQQTTANKLNTPLSSTSFWCLHIRSHVHTRIKATSILIPCNQELCLTATCTVIIYCLYNTYQQNGSFYVVVFFLFWNRHMSVTVCMLVVLGVWSRFYTTHLRIPIRCGLSRSGLNL